MLAQSSQARSKLQANAGDAADKRPVRMGGIDTWIESIAACPWPAHAGARSMRRAAAPGRPLYTPIERARRDASAWTTVQGVLAPIQFLVFLVSLTLVIRYLQTGAGYEIATASVVVKTLVLYLIMVTGSIWEKVVFDKWLFAHSFFWEDVFSMLVLALHTLYLCALAFGWWSQQTQMLIAVAAYAAYVINAAQFVWKLRAARLEGASSRQAPAGGHAA
jgi:3-vinyl bacteriochlorophyllide hydratase